jgi:hypothetical protein
MRNFNALAFVVVVVAMTVAAGAQVSAPPPDEPAIYISSSFVQDDGPVKVVRDISIDVACVSITGATARMRGLGQITLQNATVTISESVATHVRGRTVYQGNQILDLPQGR